MFWQRSLTYITALALFGALFFVTQNVNVEAGVPGNLDFRLSCSGFVSKGGRLPLNRDNTGSNQEAYTFTAYDGAGNVIYGPVTNTFPVNGELVFPDGQFQAWTNQPQVNPLFLVVSSAAGNGLPEEAIYRRSDKCALLQASSSAALSTLGIEPEDNVDGSTSPSTPLNTSPITPAGVNGVAELLDLPGYAIVGAERLNMRSGDGIQYTIVATLNYGTELIVLGRNRSQSWWYVEVDGLRGWVNASYLTLRGDLRASPFLNATGEIRPPRFFMYIDFALYSGPYESSARVCTVPGLLEYVVIGRVEDWTWYQVTGECDGQSVTGWVPRGYGAIRNPGDVDIPVTA
jgi:hypothetical protein